MSGMAAAQKTTDVPLGGVAQLDVTHVALAGAGSVTVTAATPSILTTPVVGVNIKHDEVEALASRRDLEGIANLSPGVTESTAPNAQQLNINGAFAYDNLFMINGIDVNDNLFGSPQNVFIEDAIQETQVLTSGISAEYGRFSRRRRQRHHQERRQQVRGQLPREFLRTRPGARSRRSRRTMTPRAPAC